MFKKFSTCIMPKQREAKFFSAGKIFIITSLYCLLQVYSFAVFSSQGWIYFLIQVDSLFHSDIWDTST